MFHEPHMCLIIGTAGVNIWGFHSSHKIICISELLSQNSVMTKVCGDQSLVVDGYITVALLIQWKTFAVVHSTKIKCAHVC